MQSIDHLGKIYEYEVFGQGRPLMLVHGFGEDFSVWDKVRMELQKSFKVIVPRLAGTGSSHEKVDGVSIEEMAAALKKIVDELQIEKICLFGHSMGGYIALAFAERHASSLYGFGLINSSVYPDTAEKIETRRRAMAFMRSQGTEAFLETSSPGLFADKVKMADEINSLIKKGGRISAETNCAFYEAMIKRPGRDEVLRKLNIPVLLVSGDKDAAVPVSDSLKQSSLAKLSDFHLLKDCGHLSMLEKVSELNTIIFKYLRCLP